MMRALVLALLLTGCTAPEPTMGRSDFRVQIVETPDIRHPSLLGWTMYDKDTNTCYITLRKYPICLLHEIRHCIEGPWHGDKRNNEDC